MLVQNVWQGIGVLVLTCVQVEVQHRVFFPILLQLLHGQSFEQLLLALEIRFQRGDQQAFAEAAGTTQEIILAPRGQLMYQVGLVDIEEIVCPDLFKALYAYREFLAHNAFRLNPQAKIVFLP